MKAFLVEHGVEFPKTCRLDLLLDLMRPIAPQLADSLHGTEALNPYGIEAWYAADFPDVHPGEEKAALAVATPVRGAIQRSAH